MNYRLVIHQIGLLILVLSVLIFGIWMWSATTLGFSANGVNALLYATVIGLIFGAFFYYIGKIKKPASSIGGMGRREALLLVSSSWLMGAIFAAIPYALWGKESNNLKHPFNSFVNCFFEAMSGLTTTGATILTDISTVPGPLLFWRAMTQWLGGLGIVVLFVAVLPSLGVGGKKLFKVESPGPEPEGVRPHIKDTAQVLWLIYVSFTAIQIVAYKTAGLTWFDSSCHALSTMATGGFSTHNASIGGFNSGMVNIVTIIFMVLASTNFGLIYLAMRRQFRAIWQDVEFRFYIGLIVVGSIIVVSSLIGSSTPITGTTGENQPATLVNALNEGIFTTVSMQTNTGFTSANYSSWPFIAQATIVIMMLIGGCAGSTGGGIKVIRVWVALKILVSEIERAFRPNVVRPLKVGKSSIDTEIKIATLSYVLGIFILLVIGTGGIMLLEVEKTGCNINTAISTAISTICTVGPGFAKIGAMENYAWFSDTTKIFLCVLMAIGRLEIFAVLVLLTPKFWRSN